MHWAKQIGLNFNFLLMLPSLLKQIAFLMNCIFTARAHTLTFILSSLKVIATLPKLAKQISQLYFFFKQI